MVGFPIPSSRRQFGVPVLGVLGHALAAAVVRHAHGARRAGGRSSMPRRRVVAVVAGGHHASPYSPVGWDVGVPCVGSRALGVPLRHAPMAARLVAAALVLGVLFSATLAHLAVVEPPIADFLAVQRLIGLPQSLGASPRGRIEASAQQARRLWTRSA